MATKNLVPRSTGEGQIGTSLKKWDKANFVSGSFDELTVNGESITGSLQADASSMWALTSDNLSLYPHGVIDGVVSTGAFSIELNAGDMSAIDSSQNITLEQLVNVVKGMNALTTTERSTTDAVDDYFEFDGTNNIMPKDLT